MGQSILDGFCGEAFWDSNKIWNSTVPNVTTCFEHTILTWVPCAFLWLFGPLECYFQKKSQTRTLPWTALNFTRIIVACCLAVVASADIFDLLINRQHESYFSSHLVSSILKTLTLIFSAILLLINRKTGRHTSGILFIFWFVFTLCQIISYRSAFFQMQYEDRDPLEASFISQMIFFPLLVSELLLSCFADSRHRGPLLHKTEERAECPEMSASFLSILLFSWLDRLVLLGWKKPLDIGDLPNLNPEDQTESINVRFEKHHHHAFTRTPHRTENGEENVNFIIPNGYENQPKKRIGITKMLVKTFGLEFLIGGVLKLIYDLLQFVNPLILALLMDYVSSSQYLWIGIMYAVLMLANSMVQSVVLGNYFHRMFKLGMNIRTALVSAIYKKSLVMSSSAKKESTSGEIVNLMSVDSQRFMDLMTYLNMIWSAPLQITVSIYFLWNILGASVLAGLAMSITIIPLNVWLVSMAKKRQTKQMKKKDERVKVIGEVLSGIKVLKLYGWEEAFMKKIINIRDKEFQYMKELSYLQGFGLVTWTCAPFLVSLASFACYVLVDENNEFNAKTAFVSLSLFNILRFPLSMLPHLISTLVMTKVSVKRINKFLNLAELDKYVNYDSNQAHAVTVQNGEFIWEKPEQENENGGTTKVSEKQEHISTLRDISFTVPRRSLIAVVGQVGSGKSSLLSAILGEMEKVHGSVTIGGKVAYVPQQAWIQNSTLQNNVLFSQSLSKRHYNEAIDACGLRSDLEILPGGDQTEIGEKGINLSGGQKQRVSLARAVYSNADIYLLDDPLSAVDSHVGKHIFEKVIGPNGFLNQKARILVTHSLIYLPQVDMIYVMKDGAIAEKGSFQELVDSQGPFAEFLSQYGSQIDIEEENIPPELLRSISNRSSVPPDNVSNGGPEMEDNHPANVMSVNQSPYRRQSSLSNSMEKSPYRRMSSLSNSTEKSLEKSVKEKKAKLIEVEQAETGQVKLSVYHEYFKSIGYICVLVIVLTQVITQVFSIESNIWLSKWGDDNDTHLNRSEAVSLRDYRLGVYGALGFGQAFFVLIGTLVMAYGTLIASNILHSGILKNVLRSPMSFFDTTPLGRIVNRFAKDVDVVDTAIPMTLRSWLSCFLQVVSTLVVIAMQTPLIIVVVLPISVMYYFIQRFYLSTSRQVKRLDSITRSPIYSHFAETISGASTIRAYKIEDKFCTLSNNFVDNNHICYYPSIVSNRWLAIRLDFCGNFIIFFAALFAVMQRDTLDAGQVGLSITYALMVTQTLNWMVRMSSELETNIVAVERILEYTNSPTEADWVIENNRPPEDWPKEGEVLMDSYSTRYREGMDLVLKEITCNIKSGEKVGIVGRTGAGKSSLTLSLFRIIEAAKGSIDVDKVKIAGIGLHDLRSRITIIPQDPVLFSGTLRMNLDPFDWYSDDDLWAAIEHAHLKTFVSSLSEGLEHEVVEGGENLSVGQCQLVCLARALLRKTQILVLDEATAAVDLETDSLIQATIRKEFANASVITIAHRLNTVMDYDRIMVLDRGEIVEFDSPTALIENKKTIFYGMAKDAGLV